MNRETDATTEEHPALACVPSVPKDFQPVISESRRAISEANTALAALQQQAMQALVAMPQPQPQPNLAQNPKPANPKAFKNNQRITSSKADALLQMRIFMEQRHDIQEQQEEKHDAHAAHAERPLSIVRQPVLLQSKGVQYAPQTPPTPSKQR